MLLHSQHRFRRHNSCCSLLPLNLWRLLAVVLEFRTCSCCRWGVLHRTDYCTCRHRRSYCSDCISRGITKIVFSWSTRWWKPRSHRRRHVPSCVAQRFCVSAPHTVLSSNWHHLWHHQCHSTLATSASSHLLTLVPRHPADRWPRWLEPLTLTTRWLFSKVDFFSPGSPYLVFCVNFIFAVCFCILFL